MGKQVCSPGRDYLIISPALGHISDEITEPQRAIGVTAESRSCSCPAQGSGKRLSNFTISKTILVAKTISYAN